MPGQEGKWGCCSEQRERAKTDRLDIIIIIVIIIIISVVIIVIVIIIMKKNINTNYHRLVTWPFSIARRQEMAGKLLQEEPVTLLVLVGKLQESLPWSIESVAN